MNNILIVLTGPTGVGKTDISIDIAEHFNTEIISADSRQFYREMRIGTAVPGEEQLQKIKHHFIRFISVKDYYSASIYERDVLSLLSELFRKNHIILMTGGSALYIDAVCNSIDDIPDVDPEVREKYTRLAREEGIESLRASLKILDPVHYLNVDLRNPKRIIRALEICESTGRPYSSFLTKRKKERDFTILKVGLERLREELYRRIDSRVDIMISNGLEEEAKSLFDLRHLNALNSVGYSEFFRYFEGEIPYDECVRLIKRNTRRYAKRQITWWSRDREIRWFHPDRKEEIIRYLEEYTSSKP
jgi:tRNA dimethylallyltransferase